MWETDFGPARSLLARHHGILSVSDSRSICQTLRKKTVLCFEMPVFKVEESIYDNTNDFEAFIIPEQTTEILAQLRGESIDEHFQVL